MADAGTAPEGRPWSITGLVLVGIVCGGIARSKGDGSLGTVAIVAGVISFFASFWVAFLILG